jgi:hypothetical protein
MFIQVQECVSSTPVLCGITYGLGSRIALETYVKHRFDVENGDQIK